MSFVKGSAFAAFSDQTLGNIIYFEMTRLFTFIVLLFITYGCNMQSNSNENKTNSHDIVFQRYNLKELIYPVKIIDEKGHLVKIDTLPQFIRTIVRYSKSQIDTTQIKIKTANFALKLALNELQLKYGTSKITESEPFKIALIDDKYWYINGSKKDSNQYGGVPEVIISKYDGKILYIFISK